MFDVVAPGHIHDEFPLLGGKLIGQLEVHGISRRRHHPADRETHAPAISWDRTVPRSSPFAMPSIAVVGFHHPRHVPAFVEAPRDGGAA